MRSKIFSISTSIVLAMLLPLITRGESNNIQLQLKLDPEKSSMMGQCFIENPDDSVFFLAKGLTLHHVKANGQILLIHIVENPIFPFSYQYVLPATHKRLEIGFSGTIEDEAFPKTISNQNRINSEMFELSDFINWYPMMRGTTPFNFTLTVEYPSNFGIVTNGNLVKTSLKKDRKTEIWQSNETVHSISLLGSKGLKQVVAESKGFSIEIYHSKLPDSYIDSMKTDLTKTIDLYQKFYQSEASKKQIRIIYSSRPAGGYARGGLIVVSEEYALEQRNKPQGYARDFHLNAHELAHLWSKAPTNNSDDWINEGLAEYSALLASEKMIGSDFSKLLREEYRGIIENSATQLSILETTTDCWERDINHYYKPCLLLDTLCSKVGEKAFFEFIASLDAASRENKSAHTGLFLEVLERSIDTATRTCFESALNRKEWHRQLVHLVMDKTDSTFLGTWVGTLSQFGGTSKFVLHLLKTDSGELIPTLDSPDQDVYGIPASELLIEGDEITFRLGVASAIYRGTLNRGSMIISGNWTQRGMDYPLNISKESE